MFDERKGVMHAFNMPLCKVHFFMGKNDPSLNHKIFKQLFSTILRVLRDGYEDE